MQSSQLRLPLSLALVARTVTMSTLHVVWISQTLYPTNSAVGKAPVTFVEYDWRSPTDYKTFRVRSTSNSSGASRDDQEHNSRSWPRSRTRTRTRRRRHVERPAVDPSVLSRRYVYNHQLYSLHVGSNPVSGFRDISPRVVASSPELQSKARKWIRRELQVFKSLQPLASGESNRGLKARNAEFLVEYITAILRNIDLRDSSGKAHELLGDYFGRDNAWLFLHELESWMRSPCQDLQEWDQIMQYREVRSTHSKTRCVGDKH